jgi:hypothetical protein
MQMTNLLGCLTGISTRHAAGSIGGDLDTLAILHSGKTRAQLQPGGLTESTSDEHNWETCWTAAREKTVACRFLFFEPRRAIMAAAQQVVVVLVL